MLDENIWMQLSDDEKFAELHTYLQEIITIEKGEHELSKSKQQGKLASIKKELQQKIFKIIELENPL
jgi:hypothetical protein